MRLAIIRLFKDNQVKQSNQYHRMKKLIRQSNQLILHTTHIRLPATRAAPSVAMVGDLSLAKVDSKANPYTNKATEKKSHAFIGNKRPK